MSAAGVCSLIPQAVGAEATGGGEVEYCCWLCVHMGAFGSVVRNCRNELSQL